MQCQMLFICTFRERERERERERDYSYPMDSVCNEDIRLFFQEILENMSGSKMTDRLYNSFVRESWTLRTVVFVIHCQNRTSFKLAEFIIIGTEFILYQICV